MHPYYKPRYELNDDIVTDYEMNCVPSHYKLHDELQNIIVTYHAINYNKSSLQTKASPFATLPHH